MTEHQESFSHQLIDIRKNLASQINQFESFKNEIEDKHQNDENWVSNKDLKLKVRQL